jgi:SAM-dependent methyltransferase
MTRATATRRGGGGGGWWSGSAARELLLRLGGAGLDGGLVVDLGCGTGILAAEVAAAGYAVLGIDLSDDMLAIARRRAPRARFERGSVHDAELPPCVAVTAIGEVVNYAADDRAGRGAAAALFARVASALAPGGVLLFDASAPGRASGRVWTAGEDWVICAERTATADTLTREIIAFRREGDAWRRSDERHVLRLLREEDVLADLAAAGFADAAALDAYADVALPPGQVAYAAARPRR